MRSIAATFLLALVAAAALGLAGYQWKQGNFDAIFGSPALRVGEKLYTDFQPEDVARIEIRSGTLEGVFEREGAYWQTLTPWKDRMDPVAAAAIIRFTLGMRIEDHCPIDKLTRSECGLDQKAVLMRLIDDQGETLADYKIGRVSSWKAEVEGAQQPVNTVFILPKDDQENEHVYLCTGDITPLFQDGLKLLRDHRPLYFNPLNLQKITIQPQQGEITLSHENPNQAWRIVKPLELPTDRLAMQSLIEGLFNLRASKVSDRSEVTLPANASATNTTKILLTRFGQENPTTLEIFSPESLESSSLKAVVSDRPATVFDIPAKPSPGLVSLADLPLDVNSLRDPTLTHLNIAALKSVSISPSTGSKILIERDPAQPWMATIGARSFPANEQNLFRLLKSVTSTRVSGFASDAATDFSAWGLDRPILTLRFLAKTGEALELRFGMNSKGEYFVNRTGSPTVMKVDEAFIRSITVQPHEWRHELVWSINRVDLKRLVIKRADEDPLILSYDFFGEDWKAERKLKDLTPQLVGARANFILSQLEGIKSARWLAADNTDALTALSKPSLTFGIQEQIVDKDDKVIGNRIRTLILAPAKQPEHFGHHYAMVRGDPNPFLIDSKLYKKLSTDVLDQ